MKFVAVSGEQKSRRKSASFREGKRLHWWTIKLEAQNPLWGRERNRRVDAKMATKMKQPVWHQRPRIERLAAILYPGLADDQARRDMNYFAALEKKQSPVAVRGGSYDPKKRR
jgi:hypothetical protein